MKVINQMIEIKFLCENYSLEKFKISELIDKYFKKYSPEDILLEREDRVYKQEKLIKKYKMTLLCMRVNYPGVDKNNYITLGIMKVLCHMIFKIFNNKIVYFSFDVTAEGPILTLIIDESKENVKRRAIDLEENHLLGRCVDIDVYGKEGEGISRRELGFKGRKCYICEESAQNCVRQRKHNIEEVKSFIKNKYESYFKFGINM